MRQKSLIALGFVVALTATIAVYAANQPLTAQGTITAIDVKARTITIQSGQQEHVLKVADKAEILADGRTVLLNELKKGETVQVEYAAAAGVKTAHRVERVKPLQHQEPAKQAAPLAQHNPTKK
jgi:hypothetical protein